MIGDRCGDQDVPCERRGARYRGGSGGGSRVSRRGGPDKLNPGFVDVIFANRLVVAAARVVLLGTALVALAAGVYLFGSVAYRLFRGEWLRRAGPFEPEVLEQKLEQPEDYFDEWMAAMDREQDLQDRLEERDADIEKLLAERGELIEAYRLLHAGFESSGAETADDTPT